MINAKKIKKATKKNPKKNPNKYTNKQKNVSSVMKILPYSVGLSSFFYL